MSQFYQSIEHLIAKVMFYLTILFLSLVAIIIQYLQFHLRSCAQLVKFNFLSSQNVEKLSQSVSDHIDTALASRRKAL